MPQSLPDMIVRARGGKAHETRPEQSPARTRRRSAVALAGVPLFTGFSKRHLRHLADATDEVVFRPGEAIVTEGALGETLFVILEGQAKVVRGGKVQTRLVPGDFFGEVSVLDGGPRTASVVAETPVAALRLFRRTVLELMESEPQLALALLEGIARRIREVDRTLTR
jgi:CRP/FNR family cyclic AMP-dependent transcriptional regulator